ncbi:MAG: hypothetical protein WC764_02320 [Candidatus Paceibacterota bacterium]
MPTTQTTTPQDKFPGLIAKFLTPPAESIETESFSSLEEKAKEKQTAIKALNEAITTGERDLNNKRDQLKIANGELQKINDRIASAAEKEMKDLRDKLHEMEKRYPNLKPETNTVVAPKAPEIKVTPEVIPDNLALEPVVKLVKAPEQKDTPIAIKVEKKVAAQVRAPAETSDPVKEKLVELGEEYFKNVN